MKKVPFSAVKLINTLLVMVPFVFVWFWYYEPATMTANSKQVSVLALLLYATTFYLFCKKLDGFRVSIRRIGEMIFSQIIATGVTNVGAVVIIWMLSIRFPNLLPGIICYLVQCVVIVAVVMLSDFVFFKSHPPKKAVVIYDLRQGLENLVSAYGLEKRYVVQASYPIEDVLSDLSVIDQAEDVFLCGIHSHDRNIVLKYCIANGKRVFMIPRVGDVVMSSATQMHMFHLPFLRATRYNPSLEYRVLKRLMDMLISGVALVLLSPVMLVVALMVKSDGGPVFYKQVRLTKDGRAFKILKFRSMCVDAEKYSGAVLSAGAHDPRITKVGRVIRACRLDELPQLINIFKGDMALVGPRPERPEIAAEIEKELPEFALRLQCKAGLTGYAQVYGKYNTTPYDKLLMDLMYIAHPSLLEDLTIILATVQILFSKESTEGVGEESTELKYEERNKSAVG